MAGSGVSGTGVGDPIRGVGGGGPVGGWSPARAMTRADSCWYGYELVKDWCRWGGGGIRNYQSTWLGVDGRRGYSQGLLRDRLNERRSGPDGTSGGKYRRRQPAEGIPSYTPVIAGRPVPESCIEYLYDSPHGSASPGTPGRHEERR